MKVLWLLPMKRVRLAMLGACVVAAMGAQPYRPVVVVGNSMEPTYRNGETLLAKRYEGQALAKGDLLVIEMGGETIVKRVAFLGGEHVPQAKVLGWTDDVSPFLYQAAGRAGRSRSLYVPKNKVYVRGDNAETAIDSRHFGTVPLEDIRMIVVDPRPKPPGPEASNFDMLVPPRYRVVR